MFGKGKLIPEFKTRIIPVLPVPQEGSDQKGVTKPLRVTVLKVTDWEKGSFSW